MIKFNIYAFVYLLTCFFTILFIFICFKKRKILGAKLLGVVFVFIFIWCLFYFLEYLFTSLEMKILFSKFQYIGIFYTNFFFLIFAIVYTDIIKLKPFIVILLNIINLIFLSIVFTNDYHFLFWNKIFIEYYNNIPIAVFGHDSILFWVAMSYNYAITFSGFSILLFSIFKYPEYYKSQIYGILLAIIVPIVLNIIYLFNVIPDNKIDFTPIGFLFSSIILLFTIIKFKFLNYLPLAKNLIFENINVGIIVTDKDNIIVDINAAAKNYFDYNNKEIIGKRIEEFFGNIENLSKIIDFKDIDFQIFINKKNKGYHYDITIKILKNSRNDVIGKIILIYDITEEKNFELELRYLNKDLEKEIQRAIKELRTKDELMALQSRHAAMGEMINNIAHQWKQPLSALNMIFINIKDAYEFNDLTKENLNEWIDKAQRLIEYMRNTIDDFRNFFKPDINNTSFDLRNIIEKSFSLAETSLKNNRVNFEINVPENIIIKGAGNELGQVFLNLINNSVDAYQNKDIEDKKISVLYIDNPDSIEILFADNAGGISSNIIHHIFEPYFTTKEKGTGVGLYMSRVIIERKFSGKIICFNKNNGAVFKITLPKSIILTNNG